MAASYFLGPLIIGKAGQAGQRVNNTGDQASKVQNCLLGHSKKVFTLQGGPGYSHSRVGIYY